MQAAPHDPLVPRQICVGQSFNLAEILDGTQDFRWCLRDDGWYSGVLKGHLVHLRQVGGFLKYRAEEDLSDLLTRYFRLDDNLDSARDKLKAVGGQFAELVRNHRSLRVLRQPAPWECMVAYICSANNNVDRIGEIVEMIAGKLGKPVSLGSDMRHTFPLPAQVLKAEKEELDEMRLGLNRSAKVICAAERICDGKLDLEYLAEPEVSHLQAKQELMKCYGVGPKIADCIALFALDKPEAFPLDRQIRRALDKYFPHGQERRTNRWLVTWAQSKFGRNAGFASQLLFRGQRRGQPVLRKCTKWP